MIYWKKEWMKVMPDNTAKIISKPIYRCSMAIWFVTICSGLMLFLSGGPLGWENGNLTLMWGALFLLLCLEAVLGGEARGRKPQMIYRAPAGERLFPWNERSLEVLLGRVASFSVISAVFGLLVLLATRGGPGIVDGVYCIVNHGEIQREISEMEFVILSFVEQMTFYFHILTLSSMVTGEIRKKYRETTE